MTLLGFEIELKFGKGDNKYNNEYLIHVSICKKKMKKKQDKLHFYTFTQNTDIKKACFLASKYFFIPYVML